MIISVTLNPCIDHTMFVDGLELHDRNNVSKTEIDAGGKGINLSRMAAVLGGKTIATGFLGGRTGRMVTHVLDKEDVDHDFIPIKGETRTNFSIESGDGPPTVLSGVSAPISEQEWDDLYSKIAYLANKWDWVALGGSIPPGAPANAFEILGDLAHKCGAKVLLDADGEALKNGLKMAPDMIKPNINEAERLIGKKITSLKSAMEAAEEVLKIMQESGSVEPIVALSLGDKGAILVEGSSLLYGIPPIVQPKSTIGSGDSFLGAFLTKGSADPDSLRIAIAAGTATAVSDGAHIGTKEDIDRFWDRTVILDRENLSEVKPESLNGWLYFGYQDELKQGIPNSFDS